MLYKFSFAERSLVGINTGKEQLYINLVIADYFFKFVY